MKVAFLTAGGIAPCLTASIGKLVENYLSKFTDVEIIGYLNGYKGLLLGKSIKFSKNLKKETNILYEFGGSVLGNSRVKLTNISDCIKNGYIKKGQNPLEVAANQLLKDRVTILHTIGGDDTNTTAADLCNYLKENDYDLTVVGIPKTIDNDVYPLAKTLGAATAAEQGAIFFENIVNENTTSDRQLIIHEVMGRNCGWLTAATAYIYRNRLKKKRFVNSLNLKKEKWDIHAVFLPEVNINLEKECRRLNGIMNKYDCVNVFLSEGAGLETIIADMKKSGVEILKDAFGHVRLDDLNPGEWFARKLKKKLNANKVLIQKSGYFSRSAKPNKEDLDLIFETANKAVECAIQGKNGVIGKDEDFNNVISCIDFKRIRGGKPFNLQQDWYTEMIKEIYAIN